MVAAEPMLKLARRSLRAGARWSVVLLYLAALAAPLTAPAAAAETPESARRQLERWLESTEVERRLRAVDEATQRAAPDLLPVLQAALQDPHSRVRTAAAWGLTAFPGPRARAAARAALADDDDRVRAAAVWAFGVLGRRAALAEVGRAARTDPSGLVRFRAVWALVHVGGPGALPIAVAALTDENVSVRERAAVMAIDRLADRTLAPHLVALAGHPQPATRRLVMHLLARHGGATAIATLATATRDADPLVRGEAALSLGKRRARAQRDRVAALLADPDEHVRGSAAYALGLIGDPAAVPHLRPLQQDASAFVRAVANESLHTLGDRTATPAAEFRAAELFTFPIHSPDHEELYR